MNFKEAALHVLGKEKRLLSTKKIIQIALKQGLITTDGKTPNATMSAAIYVDIKQKRIDIIFNFAKI